VCAVVPRGDDLGLFAAINRKWETAALAACGGTAVGRSAGDLYTYAELAVATDFRDSLCAQAAAED
jgi:hypothetical protein